MKLFDELKWRGLIKDITSDDLEEKLNNGGMTFYIGTDPTADSMHLGHLSSFLISVRLKEAGHNPILLIGGATGLIGDPRPTQERSMISKEEVLKNVESLTKQAKKLFGFEVVNNYDWIKNISTIDFLRDYGKYFNINYMLDKDIIRRRLDSGITFTEFSYMILQSLDFLYLHENKNVDLQVAGSDQWGNITAGVDLIRKKTGDTAYAFTMPLVTDKYGNKFGKSEGNALWLDKNKTSSYEMYQYLINLDDEMIESYLKIFTFLSKDEIDSLMIKHNEQKELRLAQKALAKSIIEFLHGANDYKKAVELSECLFSDKIYSLKKEDILENFNEFPRIETKLTEENIVDFLVNNKISSSKREAREFVSNNAISINNKKINQLDYIITKKDLIDDSVLILNRGKKKKYIILFN